MSQLVGDKPDYRSWILWKPVQSGKTADSLDLAGQFYRESLIIFVGDNNTGLNDQTMGRARVKGFEVNSYMDKQNLPMYFMKSLGKKKVLSFLMEPTQLNALEDVLTVMDDQPVTLIIDEADRSRNTKDGGTKKKGKKQATASELEAEVTPEDDGDENEIVGNSEEMPPVTAMLLRLKNLVKSRENSRTIFVTATPMGVLCAEKERWAVIYKQPYQNYVGVGLDHPANINLSNKVIRENNCLARDRWSGNYLDLAFNTFRPTVDTATRDFIVLGTKDASIKQVMLISLEKWKNNQDSIAECCKIALDEESCQSIDVIVHNGDTKKDGCLAEKIRKSPKNKVIIIAGQMASRGVSFTDFSDRDNQFELVCQVHYTQANDKLNTSMQAMRIFGPARRTVSRPTLITNRQGIEDIQHNFMESYRIIRDIAEQCELEKIQVSSGSYNTSRKMTQDGCFRFLKQGYVGSRFIHESPHQEDHLPIS